MRAEERKQARSAYKDRPVLGGVYAITNTATGRRLVETTQSLTASRNRFEFSRTTGLAVTLKLQQDWDTYGAESFVFEVLEELKKGETQTQREFANDLKLLRELWLQKGHPGGFY